MTDESFAIKDVCAAVLGVGLSSLEFSKIWTDKRIAKLPYARREIEATNALVATLGPIRWGEVVSALLASKTGQSPVRRQ